MPCDLGIFVTASQDKDNKYRYNTVTLVLLTEALKLVVSSCLYCRENTFKSLVKNVIKGSDVLALYMVPAFLYCLYNNLAFHNLSAFDPTTYYLLLQFRVVVTGVLFQIIFKKYLSRKQWLSLMLLTVGCMVKQINFGDLPDSVRSDSSTPPKNTIGFDLSINAVFILIQTVCSCLAGVYNEYLLKDKGQECFNIYQQNVFMYIDSILCNSLLLLVQGNFLSAFTTESLVEIFKPGVLLIAFNNCAIGIVTSFFLKYMNSILKTFASALELLFTAILCWILFSIPIYINTMLAIAIVSVSVYIYSHSPVVNVKSSSLTKQDFEDKRALLTEDDEDDLLRMDEVIIKKS